MELCVHAVLFRSAHLSSQASCWRPLRGCRGGLAASSFLLCTLLLACLPVVLAAWRNVFVPSSYTTCLPSPGPQVLLGKPWLTVEIVVTTDSGSWPRPSSNGLSHIPVKKSTSSWGQKQQRHIPGTGRRLLGNGWCLSKESLSPKAQYHRTGPYLEMQPWQR